MMLPVDGFRLFTAIELDGAARNYLSAVGRVFQGHMQRGRFVPEENLHLTVNFLGTVPRVALPSITRGLASAAAWCAPFAVQLGLPGCFRRGRSLLLWYGLREVPEGLRRLYDASSGALASLGYPRERRAYQAHITLARELLLASDFGSLAASLSPPPPEFAVERLVLFSSSLLRGCQIYTPLYEVALGDSEHQPDQPDSAS